MPIEEIISTLEDILEEGFAVGDRVFPLDEEEQQAMEATIHILKNMNWIPVDQRLPGDGSDVGTRFVDVMFADGGTGTGLYDRDSGEWNAWRTDNETCLQVIRWKES